MSLFLLRYYCMDPVRPTMTVYLRQFIVHQILEIMVQVTLKLTSRKKLTRYGSCFSLAHTIHKNWISSFSVGLANTSPHRRISFYREKIHQISRSKWSDITVRLRCQQIKVVWSVHFLYCIVEYVRAIEMYMCMTVVGK